MAHWTFDEATGQTFLDSSGNGRDGSFSGQVTRVDDGVFDRALRLHSSSTMATADAAGFDSLNVTVSMWVRSGDVPASGAVLFQKGARDCDGPTFGVRTYGTDGTGLEVNLMASSGVVGRATLPGDLGLWDGQWHHISFTHSWMDHLRLYVDGASWGMAYGGLVLDYEDVAAQDFTFGSSLTADDCDAPHFIGDLDDIRVYDRVLDQNQLGSLAPPIATTTTVDSRPDARAYLMQCWSVDVDPAPGGGGGVRMTERLSDGREVEIGVASNEWCAQYAGAKLAPGKYFVPLQFDTKGTHRIRARFIPGDPWQASTSDWVDQTVAGAPTTTYIEVDPVAAGEPIAVTASVGGGADSMSGSIALYDVSGTATHIETKPIPVTGAVSGSAVFDVPGRPAGTYRLEARYLGDSDAYAASSAATEVVVSDGVEPTDATPPTASAPTNRLVSGSTITSGRTTVRLAWTGSDAGSGIDRYELAQSTDAGGWMTISTSLTGTSLEGALAPAHTYRFRVRAVDGAGNNGSWMTGPAFRLTHHGEASASVKYSGTWATSTSSVYWGSKAKASSQAGAKASLTFTGRTIEVVSRKGPARGKAQIYINGVLKATLDLYASTYQNQRVVWAGAWSSSATRTITVRVVGTSGRARVDLDAFVVGS